MLLIFVVIGVIGFALSLYQILFDVGGPRPDHRARVFGGLFASFFTVLAALFVYLFPNLWSSKKKAPNIVTEKHFKPSRVIQMVQSKETYILLELNVDEWLVLHESAFPKLGRKSLARDEVVLISQSPSLPLLCYGVGDSVPYVEELQESIYLWELPLSGEMAHIPRLNTWFSERFPKESEI